MGSSGSKKPKQGGNDKVLQTESKRDDSDYDSVLNAVASGEESAKTTLAWYKLSGYGDAKKDVNEAVVLLEERVKAGDGEAMWMLGLCKEYGLGAEQDLEGAEKLYGQSREAGNTIGSVLTWNGFHGSLSGRMKVSGL